MCLDFHAASGFYCWRSRIISMSAVTAHRSRRVQPPPRSCVSVPHCDGGWTRRSRRRRRRFNYIASICILIHLLSSSCLRLSTSLTLLDRTFLFSVESFSEQLPKCSVRMLPVTDGAQMQEAAPSDTCWSLHVLHYRRHVTGGVRSSANTRSGG